MDLGSVIGIVAGIVLIGWSLGAGGDLALFVNAPSMAITVGGTLAATLVHFRLKNVIGLIQTIRRVFLGSKLDASAVIRVLVHFAERARREGLLALEDEAEELEDPFMRQGIQLVVDGTDPELVRGMLETELTFQQERHRTGQEIFQTMGNLAPAFGMIGTLIGLIEMLQNLDSPENIGPGLAVALLTTFYGVIIANLFLLPMAGKLRVSSREETLLREMVIEGVLSIQAGDNPRIVESKLRAFLSATERERMDADESTATESEEVVS